MGVEVSIGGMRKDLAQVTEGWIRDEIGRGRANGHNVCVLVSIETPRISINLATPSCAVGGGICRSLSSMEVQVIDWWKRFGLSDHGFDAEGVIAFLHKLRTIAASELRACA